MTVATAVVCLGGVLAPGVAAATSKPAPTAAVVDQSFSSGFGSNNLINEGARFVAQTFTAGRTGLLTGVSVDVFDCCSSAFALSVAIRTVGPDGAPTDLVLGEIRAGSCCPPLSQILTFPEPIRVAAGTQYAIVVSYPDAPFGDSHHAEGAWLGSTTDGYPGGQVLFFYASEPGPGWVQSGASHDVNFRTYVRDLPPVPTTISACMRSDWRAVATEAGELFRNQGECISYVEHHKRRGA